MGRTKKWINKKKVSFNMEADKYEDLKQDMLADGYESITKYLNEILDIVLYANDNGGED